MQPGFHRFGTDFGNGAFDRQFFCFDADAPRYLAERARVLAEHPERSASDLRDDDDRAICSAARAWLVSTLRTEGRAESRAQDLAVLGRELCEDFAVLRLEPSGEDRVVWVQACFPGGWCPEHVVGKSFVQVHGAVPAFGAVAAKASHLVTAMVSRGPYVRFVWTIAADDELDHHPRQGRQKPWRADTMRGFLRVERQVSVPLPSVSASVFLIRTYLYAFAELSAEQRGQLASALQQMPDDVRRYKRLAGAFPRALELLA